VLTIAAVTMAGAVVYREFVPQSNLMPGVAGQQAGGTFNASWTELSGFARSLGGSASPVQVIAFVDFECGACRSFHTTTVSELRESLGDQFSLHLVHLPLPGHRFAKQAAKASECAAEQDRFGPFVDLVMEKQDSIGLKKWDSYAQDAGVPRPGDFEACFSRAGNPAGVDSGVAAARRMGIHATSTVLVNGWQVSLPDATELQRVITEVAVNREPYPGRKGQGKQR
jgi:protein-disulfide isomerase